METMEQRLSDLEDGLARQVAESKRLALEIGAASTALLKAALHNTLVSISIGEAARLERGNDFWGRVEIEMRDEGRKQRAKDLIIEHLNEAIANYPTANTLLKEMRASVESMVVTSKD